MAMTGSRNIKDQMPHTNMDNGNDGEGDSTPEDLPRQHEPTIAETAMVTLEEQASTVQKDQMIISVLEVQFPPPGLEWLKDFERNPDSPIKKSYRRGILQAQVDKDAPVVKVGITFLAGADKPSVIAAEMSKVSDEKPFQKSPEWRVFTAVTLLTKFEVGDDLLIHHKDDSAEIFKKSNERKRISEGKPAEKDQGSFQKLLSKQNSGSQPGGQSQEIVKRNIFDHTLTIDSDEVKLLHGIIGDDHGFDIACTLVEIDMFSMRDLMMNFRTIVQSGGRNVKSKDILAILDTMINDVRRLCTRSPRLFRMSTRSLIAYSKDTRYGVDYGSNFATLTTSAGIRKLIDKSSTYYLSLDEKSTDREYIRPKFLQMIILLLSFLNNKDLGDISHVLESSFHIPGDRANLELLIMKVLPLSSISSEVFLEGLYDVYKPPKERKEDYGYKLQAKIWEELQQDIAAKGYILPVYIEPSGPGGLNSDSNVEAVDLEVELQQMELEAAGSSSPVPEGDRHGGNQRAGSWRAPWPEGGLTTSTIFKSLQHDGLLRDKENSKRGTIRDMNDIPHLEITSEDHNNKLEAIFTNKKRYQVQAEDLELISDMKEDLYVLTSLEDETTPTLEIASSILNQPFIDATQELNNLVLKIRAYLSGRTQKQGAFARVLQNNAPSVTSFAPVDEPTEAKWLWAEIVQSTGERQRVAEVFKMSNKVVYRDDILRDMNSSLSKLDKAVKRLEKEVGKFSAKKGTDDGAKEVEECTTIRGIIKRFMGEAETKRTELHAIHRKYPEDPITKVIYPSFAQTNGEKREWQKFQTQLKRTDDRLIVKSKKLVIESAYPANDFALELSFVNSALKLCVEPLTANSESEPEFNLRPGDTLLWIGYYVVLVEPVEEVISGQIVLGYFRVRSQKWESRQSGGRLGESSLKDVVSVLV
jgi:hypothetical protein